MAFKIIKNDNVNFSTPQEMFQDNKMKNIIGLIDYQSKMIDHYMETLQSNGNIVNKHVAFELPTGSGKTLIGLLIGEFHRRKYHRNVLFLCPTNQLVKQVCQQAKVQYGIDTIAFCGSQSEYSPTNKSEYFLAKKIGVTTYSSFFATSEFFKQTNIIIFDDAHSSEQYIAENWSLNIQRENNKTLYEELMEIIKNTPVGESFYSRMSSNNPYESDILDWCNMVPMPIISEHIETIASIISANVTSSNLCYPWMRIRDHLNECNIFVSWDSILIRPYIPPTRSFYPFKNADQCIFMSATLGKSGELERITGVEKIKYLPIVNEWDKKGIGRKFFIFPDLSLDATKHSEIIFSLHDIAKKSVVIVPNNKEQEELISCINNSLPQTKIYKANDLSTSKDEYKQDKNAMVIIANRFDGIDFPDDESRMLIIKNPPKVTHLQEKFFYSKMAASILYSERVKTRIVQAVGRCTRNAKDYAVVCILGNSILNDLITNSNLQTYKPEMRAEIKFGIENSTDVTDISDFLTNVKLFLSRDDEWGQAEENIVTLRDEFIAEGESEQERLVYNKLMESAKKEVALQYLLWKKDYAEAFNVICEIIAILTAPKLRGYQSFWQYLGGTIGNKLGEEYQTKVCNLYKEAAQGVLGVSWLARLNSWNEQDNESSEDNNYFESVIENLEHQFSLSKTLAQLENRINSIWNGLSTSKGKAFETYHHNLGKILGYHSEKPKGESTPDPIWIINDDVCIVTEDKIYDSAEKSIPTEDVSQAKRHENWARKNIPTLHTTAKVYTVFITNSTTLEEDARIHAEGIYYCKLNDFINWANTALCTLRDCYNTFSGEGNSDWRIHVCEKFKENSITPADFIKLVTNTELKDL